jgi:isoquinoline 1-oxidoreductase beta subunit
MDPKDVTLIDRSIPPLDIPEKVKRTARLGLDVRLPGMVYAVVAQCPYLRSDLPLRRHQMSRVRALSFVTASFPSPLPSHGETNLKDDVDG